jgi:hypothetical protein
MHHLLVSLLHHLVDELTRLGLVLRISSLLLLMLLRHHHLLLHLRDVPAISVVPLRRVLLLLLLHHLLLLLIHHFPLILFLNYNLANFKL